MNKRVAAATALIGGGGIIRWGMGERKKPDISREESKNVMFANLFFIDPSVVIYKYGVPKEKAEKLKGTNLVLMRVKQILRKD